MVSPLTLNIVIHYKACADDFPRMSAPAVGETIGILCDEGILRKGSAFEDQVYSLTDKGHFYVKALCTLPFPVSTFVIPPNTPNPKPPTP